jgi:hypothetical protein
METEGLYRTATRMKRLFSLIMILAFFVLSHGCVAEKQNCPILVLATHANFGLYAGEILKAEGFNEYDSDSLSNSKVTPDRLRRYDIIILGETPVTGTDKRYLSEYVKSGGNLIAFRPDKQLAEIFGIIETPGTLEEGYLKIDPSGDVGNGLITATLQFHGKSDLYKTKGAETVATLFSDAVKTTEFPALVINQYGHGHAAAFTYNLSKSIVYTRQGNPVWAGQERDKVDGPTATDLYYPQAGEMQWNNPDKIAIPQADEQMRLLSHVIEKFSTYTKPLPRLWYFPDKLKCLFIFTIDGEDTPEGDINNEITEVNSKGAHATLYEIGTYISPSMVNTWRSNGNEVAIHYNDVPNYPNPTWLTMNTVLDTMTANFKKTYGISPKTVRNHWVVWCSKDQAEKKEFAEQAILEEKYGLGLDCNYYQFGGNKVYPNWLGDVGHFTGSGIPMRFSDAGGRILNIYQSNTQVPDETWQKENIESKCKTLIDRSLDEENFTYINANFHTWYWGECRQPGLRVLDYCNSRGVPVWTAEKVLDFLKMKDEASFADLNWSKNHLTFRLTAPKQHSSGLTFMIPANHGQMKIKHIALNGQESPFELIIIKGSEYASLTVPAGNAYNISVNYK